MLEDQGFCGHDAPAARTQKPRQGDEQMDPQNHKIAHASNRTTLEIQQWGIAQRCAPELNFTNSHPTGGSVAKPLIACDNWLMVDCLTDALCRHWYAPVTRATFWRWVAHPALRLASKHHLRPL